MIRCKSIVVVACAAFAAFAAAACGQQATGPAGPAPRSAPATPTTSSRADDLRAKLDLLLGEHVILGWKATGSALVGNEGEFKAYQGQLSENATGLAELIGTAYGDQAKSQFGQIWSARDSALTDYALGAASNDGARKQRALASLTGQYVPQLSAFLAGLTGLSQDSLQGMLQEHVAQSQAIVDDQAARSFSLEYVDLDRAYQHMQQIGDALAPAIARKTGKFTGDGSSKAAGLRAALNDLMQEHLYAATAATDAALAGRPDELTAASALLNQNGGQLAAAVGQLFGQRAQEQFARISSTHDSLLLEYAKGVSTKNAATRQKARKALDGQYVPQFATFWSGTTGLPSDALANLTRDQVHTIEQVVDDQGVRNYTQAAQDDVTDADRMEMLVDPLAAAIVAKLPQRFA